MKKKGKIAMNQADASQNINAGPEFLLCAATKKPISINQKLYGATLGDSPIFVPLSEEVIGIIPENARKSVPGDPSFPVLIHEGFARCDGNGNYLKEGFHLRKFQFAISQAVAQKILNLHLKPGHRAQNGRGSWDNSREVT